MPYAKQRPPKFGPFSPTKYCILTLVPSTVEYTKHCAPYHTSCQNNRSYGPHPLTSPLTHPTPPSLTSEQALSNTHTGWWYLNSTFGPVGILHGNLQAIAQATRNKPKNLMNYVINRGRNGGKEDSKSLRTTMGCWTVFFEPCEVGWGWVRARVPARCARTAHG